MLRFRLSTHAGGLELEALATVSDEAVASLAKHDSLTVSSELKSQLKEWRRKSKHGRTEVEPAPSTGGLANQRQSGDEDVGRNEHGSSHRQQEEACVNQGNMLTKQAADKLLSEGYEELCDFTDMEDAAAAALSGYKGKLWFPDIVRLTEPQARVFSTHEGGLSFTALQDLSAEVASHLAASRGDLELRGAGIAEANERVVRALAAHVDGSLKLGLIRMTEETAQLLARHDGLLDLPDLEELPEAAADSLAKHAGALSVNESLLAGSCELHSRLARHPSIWVSPLAIDEGALSLAAEGKDPESVAALADGYSFFTGASDYYGDITETVLKMLSQAPLKPICIVNGIGLGEQYAGLTYYFIGTKKQVLDRISALA